MIPKQDRIKPRTVEDLERMYQFKAMATNWRETRGIARDTQESTAKTAEELTQQAAETSEQVGKLGKQVDQLSQKVESKVGVTSDGFVLNTFNGEAKPIKFFGNILSVASDKFKMTENGEVNAKDIQSMKPMVVDGEEVDSTDGVHLKDGVLTFNCTTHVAEGEEQDRIELFRIRIDGELYGFYLYLVKNFDGYREIIGTMINLIRE